LIAVATLPSWAHWKQADAVDHWTVGAEEEIMLLNATDWSLAYRVAEVLPRLPLALADSVTQETHSSVVELRTRPHRAVSDATAELEVLRHELANTLTTLSMSAAGSGLHPFALWSETRVSEGERYQGLHDSMRELARREPTLALHVHVGVPDPETAVTVMGRLRAHLPLLLALSANSPFWQGRDTGLASSRTPLFQAFPRVGIPRLFNDYAEFVDAIDVLVRADAIPDASFLWWDVRLQPALGTIEVRIMDAQTRIADTRGLIALVQSLVHYEAYTSVPDQEDLSQRPEVLVENRFVASRDGMDALLIDPSGARRPARDLLTETLALCADSAAELGCREELDSVLELSRHGGAERQRELAREDESLRGLVAGLVEQF
jgi:carboxylate-amine ligase